MKYYVVLSVLILLIIYYFVYYNKHTFWNTQPVSRKSIFLSYKDKIIKKSKNIKVNCNLDENYSWSSINDITIFKNFLNTYYSKSEIYTDEYLQWIINNPCNHLTKFKNINNNNPNVTLLYKNKLIGTIIGRRIILNINNKIVTGFYVDMLCLNNKYRGRNLAPKLISKIIDIWKGLKLDINIFKIDINPLPFDYIGKFTYYYYDLQNNNLEYQKYNRKNRLIKNIDQKNIYNAYKYFYQKIKKYQLYQILTLKEFQYYFLNKNFIKSYLIYGNNNVIIGFLSFTSLNYKHPFIENKVAKCLELTYSFLEDINVIYEFIEKFREDKYDFLVLLQIMQNKDIIKMLKGIHKGHQTFYHLYNYQTNINYDNIGLNII